MLRTFPVLIVATLLSLTAWYWLGRPVAIPEPSVEGALSCLSYTPFRADESPFVQKRIDPAHIEEDLQLLTGHTSCIRVYGSGGMEQLPSLAQKYGIQVLIGAWISADRMATRREIEAVVKLANEYPETIRGVMVGNEALLRSEIEPDELTALIREIRGRVAQPVSYADVWEFQLRHPQVAEASDFVTIHILPYWEDQPIAIDKAVDHVRKIRRQVLDRFPGKPVLIGETGWPSVGRMREEALPGWANEARFMRGFVAAARAEGWDYNLIEAFDQPWKRQLEGAVGGYWGLFDTTRHDKHLLSGDVSNHPHWIPLAFLSAVVGNLIILVGRIPLRLSPLVAVTAVGWTLQLEQLWMITRNAVETSAALLMLVTLFAASGAALARVAGEPMSPRFEARSALLLGAIAAVLSLWLVFDPRYRDFFFVGFLPAAAVMFLSSRSRIPVIRQGHEEISIGALLSISAIIITVNETARNQQALAWTLATLLMGAALVWRGARARTGME
jgi:glucan 1,3-beta-glucosidase